MIKYVIQENLEEKCQKQVLKLMDYSNIKTTKSNKIIQRVKR